MAKVSAPLLSFAARGKIADSLVFFPWKGLNAVRRYVIPTNPRTALQTTQRSYLTNIVARIHEAQAAAAFPLAALDAAAYALWASTIKAAMTWFNMACKNGIDQQVAAKGYTAYRGGAVTPGVDELTFTVYSDQIAAGHITDGTFYYGLTKSALFNSQAATITIAENKAHVVITGLTTGLDYYAQFRPTGTADYVDTDSGIYHGRPL